MTSTDDAREKQYLLVSVLLTSLSSPLMLAAVNVALPAIGSEMSMNAVQLGWVTQSLTLALVIFTLPLGRLADIIGRKKVYTAGLVVYTVSSLLLALSASTVVLIAFRVMQGVGLAMVFSTGVALLSSVYSAAERGRVLGFNVATVYLGVSLGPTIGGIITQNLGWRSLFFLSFILQLPAMALLFTRVKGDWAEAKGERFDVMGSVLFSIALFCIMYGFSSLPATIGIWIIVIGIIVLIVFIVWERRVAAPVLNIDLITRNRLFAFSALTQILYYSAIFAIPFAISLYLQYIKGFSPQDAGFVLLAQPAVQVIFSPVAGRISDRVQPRILVSIGLAITLVGLLLIRSATEDETIFMLIVSLVLLGSGIAFFTSPNTNAIMSSVEKKHYGVASAAQATSRDLGVTFSMGIQMLLFSLYMGTAQITPAYYPAFLASIRTAFLVFSALCFCSILVSAARGKVCQTPQ